MLCWHFCAISVGHLYRTIEGEDSEVKIHELLFFNLKISCCSFVKYFLLDLLDMNFIFYEILFKKKLKWKLLLLLSQSSSILFYFLKYASENVFANLVTLPSPSKFLKKFTWRRSRLFTSIAYWFKIWLNELTIACL